MELDLRRLRPVLFLIASHGWTSALAQHTYTGAQMDNLWCTPSNWNPMSVPSGDAVIPGGISQRVRMAGNCTPTFQALTAIGPVDFNGEVRYSGAVIAADIILRSGNFTMGPTIAGGATLSLTDSAEWGSGILARQAITVEAAGLLRIAVGGGHNLLRASLNNQGAVTQSAPVSIIGDFTQDITNDGLWTLAAPGVLLRTVPAIPASHHPDGTPRVLSDGRRLWHVTTLWAAARPDLPVVRVPLSSIRELDEVCWFDKAWGKPPTCRAVAEHCRRILTVDLAVPVILGPLDGNPIAVLDGMHRAVRALLEGHTDLPAVVLTSMPPPDEVLSPDDPRYDAG